MVLGQYRLYIKRSSRHQDGDQLKNAARGWKVEQVVVGGSRFGAELWIRVQDSAEYIWVIVSLWSFVLERRLHSDSVM